MQRDEPIWVHVGSKLCLLVVLLWFDGYMHPHARFQLALGVQLASRFPIQVEI